MFRHGAHNTTLRYLALSTPSSLPVPITLPHTAPCAAGVGTACGGGGRGGMALRAPLEAHQVFDVD